MARAAATPSQTPRGCRGQNIDPGKGCQQLCTPGTWSLLLSFLTMLTQLLDHMSTQPAPEIIA